MDAITRSDAAHGGDQAEGELTAGYAPDYEPLESAPVAPRHERAGRVVKLSGSLSAADLDAIVKRRTGWTMAQWDDLYRRRRVDALREGKINASRPLSHEQMIEWTRLYGFEADDFIADLFTVDEIVEWDRSFVAVTKQDSKPYSGKTLRWRLKREVIEQIP